MQSFKRSKPAPPPQPRDERVWNEDWQVGDIAECVSDSGDWHPDLKPWLRLAKGSRWIVRGFSEGPTQSGDSIQYFLYLEGTPSKGGYSVTAFRKVRPIAQEQTTTAQRILDAPVGPEIERKAPVREDVQ